MWRYVVRRVLYAIPILVGAPGDGSVFLNAMKLWAMLVVARAKCVVGFLRMITSMR